MPPLALPGCVSLCACLRSPLQAQCAQTFVKWVDRRGVSWNLSTWDSALTATPSSRLPGFPSGMLPLCALRPLGPLASPPVLQQQPEGALERISLANLWPRLIQQLLGALRMSRATGHHPLARPSLPATWPLSPVLRIPNLQVSRGLPPSDRKVSPDSEASRPLPTCLALLGF